MPKQFDKYDFYSRAVQSPAADMEFVRDVYIELRKSKPRWLREDFCGTFANSCEWVKLHRKFHACGLDLDPEPIAYGRQYYWPQLKPHQQQRVQIYQADVLTPVGPQVDIVAAFNFSYFIFKTRSIMKTYFIQAKKSLKPKGLFILDCFGGTDSQKANIEKTKRRGFTYYWDQKSFDPVTYHAKFQIHFKLNNENKKRENIFSYDWRLWTLPELRDLLEEVGFKKVNTYWEGTTKKGKGDGKFKRVTHGEECEGWIAYLVAEN